MELAINLNNIANVNQNKEESIMEKSVNKVAALLRRNHKKAAHEVALDASRQYGYAAADLLAAAEADLAYAAYDRAYEEVEEVRASFRQEEAKAADYVAYLEQDRKDHLHEYEVELKAIKAEQNRTGVTFLAADAAKALRVFTAAINGLAELKVFVMNGCKAIVTKTYAHGFGFDLQRFAEIAEHHVNVEADIHDMKGHEGTAQVQAVVLHPIWANGDVSGIRAELCTTRVNIHSVNRGYLRNHAALQSAIGTKIYSKGKGSAQIVVLDMNQLSVADTARCMAADTLTNGLFLAKLDGKKYDVLMELSDGSFKVLSGKRDEFDNLPVVGHNAVYTKNGTFKKGVRRFAGAAGSSQNTPSQGRKNQIALYENTTNKLVEKLNKALYKATLGETELNRGKVVDAKGLTDINNRQSSHATTMGMRADQGCEVRDYVVRFREDGNTDGAFKLSARCIARNLAKVRGEAFDTLDGWDQHQAELSVYGYLIQCRPYTIKAAGMVIAHQDIDLLLRNDRVLVINPNTASDALLADVNTMLSKVDRKAAGVKAGKRETFLPRFQDVDGIFVTRSMQVGPEGLAVNYSDLKAAEPEFVADFNAVKDCFDIRMVDGVNVLAVAHMDLHDFRQAHTCAQLMKCVLRAVKVNPAVKADFVSEMKAIINRQLDEDCDYSAKPKTFGREMIDTSYVSGVARDLNPTTLETIPELFRGVMEDCKRRVENTVNFDRYAVAGHSGMITSDLAYELVGESVLTMTKDYVEVIDVVWERYCAETGHDVDNRVIALKNPAMGTQEFLYIVVIPVHEAVRRVHVLQAKLGFSDEIAERLEFFYKNIKEGAVILPAHLKEIAMIAAGCDLDGDKITMHFVGSGSIVRVMWESGLPMKAVDIDNNNVCDKKQMVVDDKAYQEIMKKFFQIANKGVGQVTNGHRILDEVLLFDDTAEDNDTLRRKAFFMGIARDAFGASENGGHDYESQITVEESDTIPGLMVYKTTSDIVDRIGKQAKSMAVTWKNVLALGNDLDVVGRHVQELTIDAQKKFYKVVCGYIDAMKGYSILPLRAAIQYDLNLADNSEKSSVKLLGSRGYKLVDGKLSCEVVDISNKAGKTFYTYADAFTPFRKYAGNRAAAKLNAMRETYLASVASHDDDALARAFRDASARLRNEDIHCVRHVLGMVRIVNPLYRQYTKALKDEYITNDMDRLEQARVEEDIRKEVYERFNDVISYLDNEVRRIASLQGITDPCDLVAIAAGSNKKNGGSVLAGGTLGKMLKAETVYYLAKHSEMNRVTRSIRNASELDGMDVVEAKHGRFVGTSIETDLMDGSYDVVRDEDGNVSVERDITDFVELPKPDMGMLTFRTGIGDGFCTEEGLNALQNGQHLHIVHEKDSRNYDVLFLKDEAENVIAEVFCGTFTQKDKVGKEFGWNIVSKMYEGKEGNLLDVNIMKRDNGQQYALITLDGVTGEAPKQETAAKKVEKQYSRIDAILRGEFPEEEITLGARIQ